MRTGTGWWRIHVYGPDNVSFWYVVEAQTIPEAYAKAKDGFDTRHRFGSIMEARNPDEKV